MVFGCLILRQGTYKSVLTYVQEGVLLACDVRNLCSNNWESAL